MFEIAIQTGAMLAVVWEYRQRLIDTVRGITSQARAQRFALNVLVAFLPILRAICSYAIARKPPVPQQGS